MSAFAIGVLLLGWIVLTGGAFLVALAARMPGYGWRLAVALDAAWVGLFALAVGDPPRLGPELERWAGFTLVLSACSGLFAALFCFHAFLGPVERWVRGATPATTALFVPGGVPPHEAVVAEVVG